ncbi:cardiolipin synthase B [Oculatella sp. LEGE 06141]|uniref:phospholipase D-like domain-containing protein n=1 Tax=Oculatella sp. LEGE 06141 TaxID=1828648 RepID=UPI00187FD34C|nr:phospholipase D-like domain-containing protein [Oculatella sp. LEGE 06141]MBE9182192.1 cardiolipin synthase B [Oculatella sp. LEGE 06141]
MVAWQLWLGWLGGIILATILAVLLVVYIRGGFRRKIQYKMRNVPGPEEPHFFRALVGLATSIPTQTYPTDFFVEADAIYAARQQAIREAERSIHFETFYMTPGRRADEFAIALMERARSGVSVQVVADEHGAKAMPTRYWQQLRSAGVEVGFFRSFDWKAPLDYHLRTHRKMLLIDGRVALIGGAGVSDEWDGKGKLTKSQTPWRDFEVRYEGAIVNVLEGVFMENWANSGQTLDLSPAIFEEFRDGGKPAFVTTGNFSLDDSSPRILYHTCIEAAKQRIWVASPYFVPDRYTQDVLMAASQRGVDVRVLTMGVLNDKPIVYHTARELYHRMLLKGVGIYEYQPSMLHAKVLFVDGRWISHGSTNLDQRSFFQNDEMNVSTNDANLVQWIEQFLTESFANSRHITLEEWQRRSLLEKIRGKVGLLFRQLF